MRKLLLLISILGLAGILKAANAGDEVVVVYNKRLPASKEVAEYYAVRRHVPANQIFGFDVTTNETMSRTEFRHALQEPLAQKLEDEKLWHIGSEIAPGTNGAEPKITWKPKQSKIRYAVLCYGIPLRIQEDPELKEKIPDDLRPELRRNGAAVDSELALLPFVQEHYDLTGLIENSMYTMTNSALFNPTNGILMVTRLDGPSASIARALVDKALEAETNGLCGRGYFDLRNLESNSPARMGDDWINGAGQVCRLFGSYDVVFEKSPETFPADFPMSDIAFYCGWYDENVSGPFVQKTVEFMPGAFAYHLHSFSAATIRSTSEHWVGPLLAKGATITMGCVDEPYLSGTPDVSVFCARLIVQGFTFGEAAYSSQRVLSWQTTVVGDPLYRPFGKSLQELVNEQEKTHGKGLAWAYCRAVNFNVLRGKPMSEIAQSLENIPLTKESAVLSEKLGDIYNYEGLPSSTIEAWETALKDSPSPLQRVRLRVELADKFVELQRTKEAQADLKSLLEEVPEYVGHAGIEQRLQKMTNAPAAAAPSETKP